MRQIFWWKRLVSSSVGSWVTKARSIEAENEKKIGKTIAHSKTVVLTSGGRASVVTVIINHQWVNNNNSITTHLKGARSISTNPSIPSVGYNRYLNGKKWRSGLWLLRWRSMCSKQRTPLLLSVAVHKWIDIEQKILLCWFLSHEQNDVLQWIHHR